MDPNATLKEIVQLASNILATHDEYGPMLDTADQGADLAEHVQNLDQWIRKGGFLPQQWATTQERNVEKSYVIERFEDDNFIPGSTRYVGGDYDKAVAILADDRRAFPSEDFRLRVVYSI